MAATYMGEGKVVGVGAPGMEKNGSTARTAGEGRRHVKTNASNQKKRI